MLYLQVRRDEMQTIFDAYIRKIRNAEKKAYATEYAVWLLKGSRGSEPRSGVLSFMGAQAVRMSLLRIARTHYVEDFGSKVRQA